MSRPYLEVEVVKVKKKRISGMNSRGAEKSTKGNWAKKENLDKIKFPMPL